MGYVVRVDGDRVAAAAAELAGVGEDLARAGEALARVLQAAAAATGGPALAGAAQDAARQWHTGMVVLAGHGADLARATAEAASTYLTVEELNTGAWSVGGARWAP